MVRYGTRRVDGADEKGLFVLSENVVRQSSFVCASYSTSTSSRERTCPTTTPATTNNGNTSTYYSSHFSMNTDSKIRKGNSKTRDPCHHTFRRVKHDHDGAVSAMPRAPDTSINKDWFLCIVTIIIHVGSVYSY